MSATKRGAIITAAIVANLAALGILQIHQLLRRQSRLRLGQPLPALRHRAAARHLVLHVSPHHVSGRSAARQSAGLSARPLRALHRVLSAGDRRPAGALVGGDAPVRPRGLRAGLAARSSRSASPSSSIGLVEKILLGDPIGAHHRSDLCAGECWVRSPTATPGSRSAFDFQILFDFAGYSDIAIGLAPAVRRQAAVQFRRAVSARPTSRISGSAGT